MEYKELAEIVAVAIAVRVNVMTTPTTPPPPTRLVKTTCLKSKRKY